LEDIRRGGYSHLAEKLASPEWQPDYGPAVFLPRYGATVLGARPPLIAFNVNLATKEVKVAKEIARRIRSSGNGHRPGRLKALKAIGWYIADFDKVQVSMNITDFTKTSILEAFLSVKEEAQKLGSEVTGSELIGLAPQAALPAEWIPLLGLNELKPFDKQKKIIENVLNFD
jgi:glutamate formiminotransferase